MLIKDALGIGNKAVEGRERAQETSRAANRNSGGQSGVSTGDRVELSGRSKEMAKAYETLTATPEVRQDKVDAIKASIADGSYQVDADKVANKMIMDFLNEIV